jgi:hypothetical protein
LFRKIQIIPINTTGVDQTIPKLEEKKSKGISEIPFIICSRLISFWLPEVVEFELKFISILFSLYSFIAKE